MTDNYKVVVAHPYKQHSYEMAKALIKNGLLFKYITTVYYKPHNLTWFITCFIKGKSKKKAFSRQSNEIDLYVKQYCEFEGLIKLYMLRKPRLMKYYNFIKYHSSDRFARKVARYCMANKVDAVVVYDDTSPLLSEILKQKAPEMKIIMDVSAPSAPFLREVYLNDMLVSPYYAEKLLNERRNVLDKKLLERSVREINAADYFIVASNFSKKSIEFCGKPESNIYKCEYGIDSSIYLPGHKRSSDVLQAVFIGGTNEYKGISYLLEAFRRLSCYPVHLIIIGTNNLDTQVQICSDNVTCTGVLLPEEVVDILKNSDFMVFPSLGDGFGLSVIEALSSGCPVICSSNTGASDLITDYYNGFVIPTHKTDPIVDKILFFINNRDELSRMQNNARDSVKRLTWTKYYKVIGRIIISICSINK